MKGKNQRKEYTMRDINKICFMALALVALLALVAGPVVAQQKPNILII
jgi:hypothetical protein